MTALRIAVAVTAAVCPILLSGVPVAAQQTDGTENDEALVLSLRETTTFHVSGVTYADAIARQGLIGNTVVEGDVHRRAVIENSFNDTHGLIGVNQSSGALNNQANVQAVAIVTPDSNEDGDRGSIQILDAAHVMVSRDNSMQTGGSRTALIENSFNDTSGIVGVNQAAGSLNQQANVVALTLGADADIEATLMGDTILAGVVTEGNNLEETEPVTKEQGIRNSFNNFNGIAQVSSVAGDMNSVSNVMSVSVRTVGGP